MKILVHLVSGQNLPNYIASKIIKADRELFLYTKDSIGSLKQLQDLFPDSLPPIEIPAWDFNKLVDIVKDLIALYQDSELFLNFTAGNKIMSMAAFSAFTTAGLDRIYINSQDDEYIYFDHKNRTINRGKISIICNLEDLIHLNGQEISFRTDELSPQKLNLFNFLRAHYPKYSKSLLKLAFKYDNKLKSDFTLETNNQHKLKVEYKKGISSITFYDKGNSLISFSEEGSSIIDFCFGGWFEYECFEIIRSLNYFDDIRLNCKLEKLHKGTNDKFTDKNEIDILALKGIYPVVIECKSGGIRAGAIDKLVSLKQTYLGRYSSTFLITYFPLNDFDENHLLLQEKMEDNRIIHLSYRDLKSKFLTYLQNRGNLK